MRNVFDKVLRWFTASDAEVQKPSDDAPREARESAVSRVPDIAPPPGGRDQNEPENDSASVAAETAPPRPVEPARDVPVAAPVPIDAIAPEETVDEEELAELEAEPVIVPRIETSASGIPPEPAEIERRRQLVRTLFNDFWSGRFDKPAAFVDRLDEAESYLNERLAASGEPWQLDAATRKMLGLPQRSNSAA